MFIISASAGVAAVYLIICIVSCTYQHSMIEGFLRERQEKLQEFLDRKLGNLQTKHRCKIVVGPYGCYLKVVFSVRILPN